MDQLILVGVVGLFTYFVMIRPQQKRIKEAQNMLNSVQKGSHVVTVGGLHGVVEELTDTTVVLDCEGVYLTFERRAISRIVTSHPVNVETQASPIVEEVNQDEQ